MTQTQNDVFKIVDLLEIAKRIMPCVWIDPKMAQELKTIFKGEPKTVRIKDMATGQFKETQEPGYNQAALDQLDSRLDLLVGSDKKKGRTAG